MDLLDAFREGQSTADVRRTKIRALWALATAPGALTLYSVVKAYWPDCPFTVEDAAIFCTAVTSAVGIVSHLISTQKLGVRRAEMHFHPAQTSEQRRRSADRTYG